MKTVSLLGSGWLGSALAKHFLSKNIEVKASTRSAHRMKELEALGAQPFLIDIDAMPSDLHEFLEANVVIVNITSKKAQLRHTLATIGRLKGVQATSSTGCVRPCDIHSRVTMQGGQL